MLTDEPYLSNRSYLHVCEQHHASSIFLNRMGIVFYCRRNMGERMEALTKGDIWKVLIRWEWLCGVCVPYNSDGKIRCERVELVEIVERN